MVSKRKRHFPSANLQAVIYLSKDEELLEEQAAKIEEKPEAKIQQKGLIKKIVQKLLAGYKRLV